LCRSNKRGRGNSTAGSAANAYVRISEQEIADDYPLPAQYEKEEEEADELLLWDEEGAWMDPEDLPKQLLDDFSIYNAEVGSASLMSWFTCRCLAFPSVEGSVV
jgi:DNA (cytosine-5)-methyltransferase 1